MQTKRSILLLTSINLLMNLAFSGCSCGQAPTLGGESNNTFPTIQSSSLNDKTFNMPDDFATSEVFVILGFTHESKEDVALWAEKLENIDPQLPVYEIPVISGFVPGLLEGVIRGGMKKKYSPKEQEYVIPVFADADKLDKGFTRRGENECVVVLLNMQRKVVGEAYGKFTDGKLHQLRKILVSSFQDKVLKSETM